MKVNNNSSSSLLHVNNPTTDSSFGSISLQFFVTETLNKTNSLTAYYFHTDRTGFFPSIANALFEFSLKKKAILVKTDAYSDPVYVKIKDLSKALGIKKKVLIQNTKGMTPDEVSAYLKMEACIKKIQENLEPDTFCKGQIEESLLALSGAGIALENVAALMKKEGFSSEKMAKALMELGATLKGNSLLEENFEENQVNSEFEPYRLYINGSDIYIEGIEENGKNSFRINPITFDFQTERAPEKIQGLITQFNLDSTTAYRSLNALARRISYPTIEHLLNTMKTDDDKKVMLNTFIHIGQDIRVNSEVKYFKETKSRKELEAYSYGLSADRIFIAIAKSKGGKLGEGSYKLVNSAIKIDNFAGQDFSTQVESYARIKPNPKKISRVGLKAANKNLLEESESMGILKDNPFAIEPHLFRAYSTTGKVVLFQKRYDGDGNKLFHARVHHQLNALKELGMGLDLLHKKNVVHMDVKPPNLFISGNIKSKKTPVQGKVADIGLLTPKGEYSDCGSIFYLPPEALLIINGREFFNPNYRADESADSYSYGLTILETILPKRMDMPFFGEKVDTASFQKKVDGFLKTVSDAISKNPTPENLKRLKMLDVCRNLIQFDPKNRLSCGEAAKALEDIQLGIV